MKTNLLLAALTLVITFSVNAFGNDMYAHLRVTLETDNLALEPLVAKNILREFLDIPGVNSTVEAGLGAIQNEEVRTSLTAVIADVKTMSPWGAKAAMKATLGTSSLGREVSVSEVTDELIATTVIHMVMWNTFSRWMTSNSENSRMVCPPSYTLQECVLFSL